MESERKMKSLPKQACREEIMSVHSYRCYVGMHNQDIDHIPLGSSQMLKSKFLIF